MHAVLVLTDVVLGNTGNGEEQSRARHDSRGTPQTRQGSVERGGETSQVQQGTKEAGEHLTQEVSFSLKAVIPYSPDSSIISISTN